MTRPYCLSRMWIQQVLGEYLVDTDQLKNSTSTFFPSCFSIVASDKASLLKIVEGEDLTIFGNVGNVTIDVNGGATAKGNSCGHYGEKG